MSTVRDTRTPSRGQPPEGKNRPRKFDNLGDGALADELGDVRMELAALKARDEELRDELLRRGVKAAIGEKFRLTVTQAIRHTLDADRVKHEQGLDWWDDHLRETETSVVKVKEHAR